MCVCACVRVRACCAVVCVIGVKPPLLPACTGALWLTSRQTSHLEARHLPSHKYLIKVTSSLRGNLPPSRSSLHNETLLSSLMFTSSGTFSLRGADAYLRLQNTPFSLEEGMSGSLSRIPGRYQLYNPDTVYRLPGVVFRDEVPLHHAFSSDLNNLQFRFALFFEVMYWNQIRGKEWWISSPGHYAPYAT